MEYRKSLALLTLIMIMYLTYKLRKYIDKRENEKLERQHRKNLHKNNA